MINYAPITQSDIARKQQAVRQAYAAHGFHSSEYQRGFDELHDLRMRFMAQQFRKHRGLPPNYRTPYCS